MKELCELVGIDKIRTAPYHPQTNGQVERMHKTFKDILAKCDKAKFEWSQQIPYILFVLRQIPHADSGFSPFQLVYGHQVRTPLDILYHNWYETRENTLNACEWVNKVADRLSFIRDIAMLKLTKCRKIRTKQANRIAS